MSATRHVRTRRGGVCDREFAHPSTIRPGDIVAVTTYYPGDEFTRDFGVPPFTRTRACQWCVIQDEAMLAKRGGSLLQLRDRHGDIWEVGEDSMLHTRETAPFTIEHVQRKWAPLTVVRQQGETNG